MTDVHLYSELLVQMFREVLRRVDTAMLSAGATEGEHEVGEATVDVTLHVSIGEFVDAIEEGEYLTVVLEEAYHGLVESGELLVRFIASGVVRRTTVEHVSAAITRLVAGMPLRNEKLNTRTRSGPLPSYFENVAGPS